MDVNHDYQQIIWNALYDIKQKKKKTVFKASTFQLSANLPGNLVCQGTALPPIGWCMGSNSSFTRSELSMSSLPLTIKVEQFSRRSASQSNDFIIIIIVNCLLNIPEIKHEEIKMCMYQETRHCFTCVLSFIKTSPLTAL